MVQLLLVAVGGGLGAMTRYMVGRFYVQAFGPANPWGATFLINVTGGLLMGLLVGALALKVDGGERLRLVLGVGVLGGYTTFSSYALEAVMLLERKAYLTAAGYIAGSAALSILGVMLGLLLTRRLA
jgi:CrcB protein